MVILFIWLIVEAQYVPITPIHLFYFALATGMLTRLVRAYCKRKSVCKFTSNCLKFSHEEEGIPRPIRL